MGVTPHCVEPGVMVTERIRLWINDAVNSGRLTPSLRQRLAQQLDKSEENTAIPFSLLKSVFELYSKDSYLHELLDGTYLSYPKLPVKERDPVLEARIQKLKAEQAEREYNNMIKNVASKTLITPEDSLGHQYKLMNRQLFVLINFVLTVVCVFVFGYKATEYYLGKQDLFLQLMMGVIFGTVVFFADLYFILKNET